MTMVIRKKLHIAGSTREAKEEYSPTSALSLQKGVYAARLSHHRRGWNSVVVAGLAAEVEVDRGSDDERENHRDQNTADHRDGERLQHL